MFEIALGLVVILVIGGLWVLCTVIAERLRG